MMQEGSVQFMDMCAKVWAQQLPLQTLLSGWCLGLGAGECVHEGHDDRQASHGRRRCLASCEIWTIEPSTDSPPGRRGRRRVRPACRDGPRRCPIWRLAWQIQEKEEGAGGCVGLRG